MPETMDRRETTTLKTGSSRMQSQRVSCSRPDPADAWLQAAFARSIEIFWRDPPSRARGHLGRAGGL